MTITLSQVNADNWREALQLAVQPDQLRFVAESAPIVARNRERIKPKK